MKSSPAVGAEHEPIGIVISRGAHQEHAPAVLAYIWGPAPESSDEPVEGAA